MRKYAAAQLLCAMCASAQIGFNTPGPCWDGVVETNDSGPNVWLIVMDDNDYEAYGEFGGNPAHTPNLDFILQNSAVFRNGFVPMSVCRPSLAALLSGKNPERTGIRNYHSVASLRVTETLPREFRAQQYMTFLGGKFWEHRGGTPEEYGFRCVEAAGMQNSLTVLFGRDTQSKFLEMITEARGAWFAFWAPLLPHTPYDASMTYQSLIDVNLIDVPPEISDPAAYRQTVAGYLANLAWVDAKIGEGLAALSASGQLENTLIVTLTDNGIGFGHYSKQSPFDKGLKTHISFMLMSAIDSAEYPDLVTSTDIVPTIAELCGLAVPAYAQGISLAPRVLGTSTAPTRTQVSGATYSDESVPGYGTGVVPVSLWTRTPTHKYIKFLVPVNSTTLDSLSWQYLFMPVPDFAVGAELLFDIEQDPYERVNLASDPANGALLASLRAASADWFQAELAAGQDQPDPCIPRSADLNGDGSVGLSDLSILLSNFGVLGVDAFGNLNCDLDVDISDLSILLAQFGE